MERGNEIFTDSAGSEDWRHNVDSSAREKIMLRVNEIIKRNCLGDLESDWESVSQLLAVRVEALLFASADSLESFMEPEMLPFRYVFNCLFKKNSDGGHISFAVYSVRLPKLLLL